MRLIYLLFGLSVLAGAGYADYRGLSMLRPAETKNVPKSIREGVTKEQAIQFTKDCKKLGLYIHGAFIMGLPGETRVAKI